MHEALAHVGHRQRHAHARLDQIGQRRIGRVAPFDDEPDRGDGLAQVVGDRRERRRGAGDRECTAHDGCAEAIASPGVHATRTRASRGIRRRRSAGLRCARSDQYRRSVCIELELDDLIVERGVQAPRERQERAIGNALADRQARRRVEARRVGRIDEGRRQLERVEADRLLRDLRPLRSRSDWSAPASRGPSGCRSASGSSPAGCAVRARSSVRCTSLSSSARTSAGRQRRIGLELQVAHPLGRARPRRR